MAQRWDIICVFFSFPSLNASDSTFILLIPLLCSFGLQCSVIMTLSFTGQWCWLYYTWPELQLNQFWGTQYKVTAATGHSLFFGTWIWLLLLKNWLIPTRTLNVFSQGLPKSRIWSPGCNDIKHKSFSFSLEKSSNKGDILNSERSLYFLVLRMERESNGVKL